MLIEQFHIQQAVKKKTREQLDEVHSSTTSALKRALDKPASSTPE
jgi:hypothetical protein